MNSVRVGEDDLRVEVDGVGDDFLVLAHGAGGSMDAKTILALRDVFVARGFRVARFNFPYKQRGRSLPDKMPVLVHAYTAVADALRLEFGPKRLFLGGHSMGGRTASHLAAEQYPMDGLVLLAYPLHPAGKPEKLRVEHLEAIRVPTLCINGTQDELCTVELMNSHRPSSWTMHWLEGADHSYTVKGRKAADVLAEIGDSVRGWVDQSVSQT